MGPDIFSSKNVGFFILSLNFNYFYFFQKHTFEYTSENAVAERVNGILKEEFMLSGTFPTKELAYKAVHEAIKTYNELRPHMSIDYMTPNQKYAA